MKTLVITTCKAFAPVSLPPLLKSLQPILEDPSWWVFNVADDYLDIEDFAEGPVNCGGGAMGSPLRCFEMTGPLEYAQEVDDRPFLAIHDTCIAGPKFKELAEASLTMFDGAVGGNLPNYMHCCMGLFHPKFLCEYYGTIRRELNHKGKRAAVKFETEARLLQLAGPYYQNMGWGIRDGIRHVDIYGTGTPRWERYFPGLDLWKYTLSNTIEGVSETPQI
jgi:hypothetical protein